MIHSPAFTKKGTVRRYFLTRCTETVWVAGQTDQHMSDGFWFEAEETDAQLLALIASCVGCPQSWREDVNRWKPYFSQVYVNPDGTVWFRHGKTRGLAPLLPSTFNPLTCGLQEVESLFDPVSS